MKLLEMLRDGKAFMYVHNILRKDKHFIKLLFEDIEVSSLEDFEVMEDIFENIDEDCLKDKDLVLFLIQKLHSYIENLVNFLDKDDKEGADDILDIYEDFFEDLDDTLRADKDIVIAMFDICEEFRSSLSSQFGFSNEIVEECIDFIEDIFEEIDESLLVDECFLDELVERYPYINELEFENENDDEVECSCGESTFEGKKED